MIRGAHGFLVVLICLLTCNLDVFVNCCTQNEFSCVSETTDYIPIDYKCDGTNDCSDFSDETNCTSDACPEGLFRCDDNTCSTLEGCNDTQTVTASVTTQPEPSTNEYESSATTQHLAITETSTSGTKTTTDNPTTDSKSRTDNTPTSSQLANFSLISTAGTSTTLYESTITTDTSIRQTTSGIPTATSTDTSTKVSQIITEISTSGPKTTDSQTNNVLNTTYTTTDVTVSITPTIRDLPDESNDRDTVFLRIFIPVAAVVISSILIISLYVFLKQRKIRTSTPDKTSCHSSVELSDISGPSENSDYHQLLKISSFNKRLYMYEVEWIRYMNKEYMTGHGQKYQNEYSKDYTTGHDQKYQNEYSKEYMTGHGQKYQNEYSKEYMTGHGQKYQNENSKQDTTGQDQK